MSDSKETTENPFAKLIAGLAPALKKAERSFITDDEELKDKYPLTVKKVDCNFRQGLLKQPSFVSVRLASKEDRNTYLGILLGDVVVDCKTMYDPEEQDLTVGFRKNPAIYVPTLGRIVMGMESWWQEIGSAEDLRQITDEVINSQPYVQMLQQLIAKEEPPDEPA